ncbi:MAG: dTMP kinase [Elusimicrobia bacterium]|nr:dTMP kinase [Elusimicrobiota bacterium]
MSTREGFFVVLEGPDKSGKSTQAKRLVDDLRQDGLKVIHTREPGGTSFAESIRKILLDTKHKVDPMAELLLYEAARAQHTRDVLVPSLEDGAVVVCERYTLATLVYQGRARGLEEAMIRQLNRLATGGLRPDLTLVLDIPQGEFGRRDKRRKHDRMERETVLFRSKVREGYRALAKREPRTVLLDASEPVDRVEKEILQLVHAALREKAR